LDNVELSYVSPIRADIEQPATEERAAVQVKSSTSQKVFDEYIAAADQTNSVQSAILRVSHPQRESDNP
jgi:hypothetical protein